MKSEGDGETATELAGVMNATLIIKSHTKFKSISLNIKSLNALNI